MRNPSHHIGVSSSVQVRVGVGSVVESLLGLPEPNCKISISKVLNVGCYSLLSVGESENKRPLCLGGRRNPLEPTTHRVLTGEIIVETALDKWLFALLEGGLFSHVDSL